MLATLHHLAGFLLVLQPGEHPPLVGEQRQAPAAWAAVIGQELWVCWDAGEPPTATCWQRVPDVAAQTVQGPFDPLALAFIDQRTLAVGTLDAGVQWVVQRGQGGPVVIASAADDAAVLLVPPTRRWCSSGGWLPTRSSAGWSWEPHPCNEGNTCLAVRPWAPRVRVRPPIAARLVVEVGRHLRTRGFESSADLRILVALSVTFGPLGRSQAAQRWRLRQELARTAVPVPSVLPGPLAARETAALRAILCGESS